MDTSIKSDTDLQHLSQKWDQIKIDQPKLRTKDVADQLGVSEAELIASKCDGKSIIRLQDNWEGIFKNLESLGTVMALTRNGSAVHEKTGIYENVSFSAHNGLALSEQIDLRIFHKRWGFGFALPVENARGVLHSIQFFDKQGDSIHKIFVKDDSKLPEYEQLVNTFKADVQQDFINVEPLKVKEDTVPVEDVDQQLFLEAWSELKDTHDFYSLLRKHKIDRTAAFKLAEQRFTTHVPNSTLRIMLEESAKREIPIMVFVGNTGMIQIHSGPVQKIKIIDNWLNILDPGFNLHLREDHIQNSWIVEKPTVDGIVTSLEVFNSENDPIATFFGARKPGKAELESWRELASELKTLEVQ